MNSHLYLYLLVVGLLTALTPWAIVGVIVMLGSRGGARVAGAFTLGWFSAVTFIAAVVTAGFGGAASSTTQATSRGLAVVELVLGLVLLAFGVPRWRRARAAAGPSVEPGWLRKLDHLGPIAAFAFGTFMINVVFVVDAGLRIAASGVSGGGAVGAVLFYAVVASSALLAVLVVYVGGRATADVRLRAMRSWVAAHNPLLMAAIVVAIGALLAAKGIAGLILN